MRYDNAKLDTPVSMRYDVTEGKVQLYYRDDPRMMYGVPRHKDAFIWPESEDRYIVVLLHEVREMSYREYGCYHSMPSLDAAIMFVFAST